MLLTRGIIVVLLLQLSTVMMAQVTERERNTGNRPTTRDTNADLKKKVIHQYDSLINNCNLQILLLNKSITDDYKQIEVIKQQSKQAEADHAAWVKNPPRYLTKQQLAYQSEEKYQALLKTLNINDKKIDALLGNINAKKNQIKDLQFQISKLEKDKAAAISKFKL